MIKIFSKQMTFRLLDPSKHVLRVFHIVHCMLTAHIAVQRPVCYVPAHTCETGAYIHAVAIRSLAGTVLVNTTG